jgi:pimeloyl-ACP methyl ester carboxylesterase
MHVQVCLRRCAFVLLIVSTAASAQSPPEFSFTQAPRPYAVGLRVIEQYDPSRTFRAWSTDAASGRPLQTLVWYPAVRAGRTMTVGDYIALLPSETRFDSPRMPPEGRELLISMKRSLHSRMWAIRDARPLRGRFPVVIYAPSFSWVPWENADLCEYLASHGYIVISSTSMGSHTREMTFSLEGIRAQAQDISFLVGYSRTLADADTNEVAVVGYSWGGISNLFAAAQDSRIKALVALDGSMRYYPGLVKEGGVHPEQMQIPLIFFTEGELTLEDLAGFSSSAQSRGPNVLNEWTHADLITAHMLALPHVGFSSMFQRDDDVWVDFSKFQKADYDREDCRVEYGWVARYTLAFLDSYLKHDREALAFLERTPSENGVPRHFMAVSYRQGKGIPPSFEWFVKEVESRGFDQVADIYASMQKENHGFKLDDVDMRDWAYELQTEGRLSEAIKLLELDIQVHPDSDDAYTSLGDAYRDSGQRARAVEIYEEAIRKDPQNTDALVRLNRLKQQP